MKIFQKFKKNFFRDKENFAICPKYSIIGANIFKESFMENTIGADNGGFIKDLDDFFAKKFSDFDMISAMPSYESITVAMILKNKNRIEEGEYAANEMRKIAYQPDPAKVLAEIKERYVDASFTFSFRVAPFKVRLSAFFGGSATGKYIAKLIQNYGEDPKLLWQKLGLAEKDWKAVLRGYFIPEKSLIYKITLLLGISREDNFKLMQECGCYYDFADARDVVVRYLVDYRVYNREMIDRAFEEYKLRKLL